MAYSKVTIELEFRTNPKELTREEVLSYLQELIEDDILTWEVESANGECIIC